MFYPMKPHDLSIILEKKQVHFIILYHPHSNLNNTFFRSLPFRHADPAWREGSVNKPNEELTNIPTF